MKVRALVVRPSDRALLMLPSGVPELEQPDDFWFPDVEPVVSEVRRQFGIDAVVLACVSEDPLTYLMIPSGDLPADAQWVHDEEVTSSELPDWTRPAWYGEAPQWIAEHSAAPPPPIRGVDPANGGFAGCMRRVNPPFQWLTRQTARGWVGRSGTARRRSGSRNS